MFQISCLDIRGWGRPDKIILPAMQGIAQQCASHINELQCPPEFIALMLRDIADAIENPSSEGESDCECR